MTINATINNSLDWVFILQDCFAVVAFVAVCAALFLCWQMKKDLS